MNKPISLNIKVLDPFYFLYMFFKSPLKEKVKEAHNKKLLDICVKESEDRIEVSNFTEIDLE